MSDHWTFALATPEAVVGGKLPMILERLAAHGLQPMATRVVPLDVPRMARMYTHLETPPAFKPARDMLPVSVLASLYALAPGVLVVLAGEQAGQAVLAAKGATRPEEAAKGTIRALGENVLFNLLHCPDDEAAASIELAYLVGPEAAAGLRAIALAPHDARLDFLLGPAASERALPAWAGPEAIGFPAIARRLAHRLLQHAALLHREDATTLARLITATAALLAADGTALTAAARLAAGAAAQRAAHAALPDDPALAALAELFDLDGAREFAPFEALAARGIYLSPLEAVMLDAHRHAHGRPDAPPVLPRTP